MLPFKHIDLHLPYDILTDLLDPFGQFLVFHWFFILAFDAFFIYRLFEVLLTLIGLYVVLDIMSQFSKCVFVHFAHPFHVVVIKILLEVASWDFEELEGVDPEGVLLLQVAEG